MTEQERSIWLLLAKWVLAQYEFYSKAKHWFSMITFEGSTMRSNNVSTKKSTGHLVRINNCNFEMSASDNIPARKMFPQSISAADMSTTEITVMSTSQQMVDLSAN